MGTIEMLNGTIISLGNIKKNRQSVKNLLRKKRFKGKFKILVGKGRINNFTKFKAIRKTR